MRRGSRNAASVRLLDNLDTVPMAKHPGIKKATQAIEKSAMEIALGIQRPGQTKDQTKLIARGIEKGIAQYKKRQGAKERELDKALKQLERVAAESAATDGGSHPDIDTGRVDGPAATTGRRWLPWTLLILTWVGIAAVAGLRL